MFPLTLLYKFWAHHSLSTQNKILTKKQNQNTFILLQNRITSFDHQKILQHITKIYKKFDNNQTYSFAEIW